MGSLDCRCPSAADLGASKVTTRAAAASITSWHDSRSDASPLTLPLTRVTQTKLWKEFSSLLRTYPPPPSPLGPGVCCYPPAIKNALPPPLNTKYSNQPLISLQGMSDTKREWVPSVTLLLQNSVFKSGNGNCSHCFVYCVFTILGQVPAGAKYFSLL